MTTLRIKRIYQKPDHQDGIRILIDGLWPRGIKKIDAKVDLWLKEVAPSPELRQWFNHESEKWPEFCKRYHVELKNKKPLIQTILEHLKKNNVTLLYGAKEERFNNAVALKKYIEQKV